MIQNEPTKAILQGRRSLEGISGYSLVDDLRWHNKEERWSIKFRLELPLSNTELIPKVTYWYLLFSHSYPWGAISLHPSQEGGISYTFQHQNNNQSSKDLVWKSGDLCVKTSLRSFARRGYDIEPYDANSRLFWHVERAKLWIELASNNELTTTGEPFELPHYPQLKKGKIAFSENIDTFNLWNSSSENSGLACLKILQEKSFLACIDEVHTLEKISIIKYQWGSFFENRLANEVFAIWIRLNSGPVLFPWQGPVSWEELFKAALEQGIDLNTELVKLYQKAWRYKPNIILLCFPIPANIDQEPIRMHWLAIKLDARPKLKGFRENSIELIKTTYKKLFHPTKPIPWILTENWDKTEITARGKHQPIVTEQSILIIGVGAVGSVLAELLCRAGCYKLTLLDADVTNLGNLSRHTLTVNEIEYYKAEAVADRLNKVFPHNTITFFTNDLDQQLKSNRDFLLDYETVIDATASDEVIFTLTTAVVSSDIKFISLSLGINAKRLFCYMDNLNSEMDSKFRKKLTPWLIKEKEENTSLDLPREGIGCWHPLFPARIDDVWMMTAASIKIIEPFLTNLTGLDSLITIEQNTVSNQFDGLRVIRE